MASTFLLRRRCPLSHPHSCSIRVTEFGIARSRLLIKIDREIRGVRSSRSGLIPDFSDADFRIAKGPISKV
ncbi:hypothetical protein LXL04_033377 [Taraxacum kok-saghyz]